MTNKKDDDTEEVLHCSFCGKSQKDVKKLIAGRGVYICDECIDVCHSIMEEEFEEAEKEAKITAADVPLMENLPTPSKIKSF